MSAAGRQASLYGFEASCNNIRGTNAVGTREAYKMHLVSKPRVPFLSPSRIRTTSGLSSLAQGRFPPPILLH